MNVAQAVPEDFLLLVDHILREEELLDAQYSPWHELEPLLLAREVSRQVVRARLVALLGNPAKLVNLHDELAAEEEPLPVNQTVFSLLTFVSATDKGRSLLMLRPSCFNRLLAAQNIQSQVVAAAIDLFEEVLEDVELDFASVALEVPQDYLFVKVTDSEFDAAVAFQLDPICVVCLHKHDVVRFCSKLDNHCYVVELRPSRQPRDFSRKVLALEQQNVECVRF